MGFRFQKIGRYINFRLIAVRYNKVHMQYDSLVTLSSEGLWLFPPPQPTRKLMTTPRGAFICVSAPTDSTSSRTNKRINTQWVVPPLFWSVHTATAENCVPQPGIALPKERLNLSDHSVSSYYTNLAARRLWTSCWWNTATRLSASILLMGAFER